MASLIMIIATQLVIAWFQISRLVAYIRYIMHTENTKWIYASRSEHKSLVSTSILREVSFRTEIVESRTEYNLEAYNSINRARTLEPTYWRKVAG